MFVKKVNCEVQERDKIKDQVNFIYTFQSLGHSEIRWVQGS